MTCGVKKLTCEGDLCEGDLCEGDLCGNSYIKIDFFYH